MSVPLSHLKHLYLQLGLAAHYVKLKCCHTARQKETKLPGVEREGRGWETGQTSCCLYFTAKTPLDSLAAPNGGNHNTS